MLAASKWVGPAVLAAPLFVSTNADDLVLLTIFFSQRNTRASTIVLGQVVGLGALTLASILAARLAVQLPGGWIPFLGLVPIYLGLRAIFSPSDDDDVTPAKPALHWWTVALVTIANGGDNLGVYIPVFAAQSWVGIAVIAAMFLLFTVVWCGLAAAAVRHPTWGDKVRTVSARFGPWVLITVGIWIFSGHPFVRAWFD